MIAVFAMPDGWLSDRDLCYVLKLKISVRLDNRVRSYTKKVSDARLKEIAAYDVNFDDDDSLSDILLFKIPNTSS